MAPRKKTDISTPTKHLDCTQLWIIQKCNCRFVELMKKHPNSLPELVNTVESAATILNKI